MKKRMFFCALFLTLILALSCIFVSAEDVETPETEIETEEYEGDPNPHPPIWFNPSPITLGRGEMMKLQYTRDVSTGTISWSSSNSHVVVSSDGYIRGASVGTATITATLSSVPSGYSNTATCTVTVTSQGVLETGDYLFRSKFTSSGQWYARESTRTPGDGATVSLQSLYTTGCVWTVVLGNDGYYTIRSSYSGKFIKCYNNNITPWTLIVHSQTISNGCKWAVIKESNGRFSFVPYGCNNGSVRLSAEMSEDETYMCLRSYSSSNASVTQWSLTRMLPLSGAELAYQITGYNPGLTGYQYAFNIVHHYYDPTAQVINIHEGTFLGTPLSDFEDNGVVIVQTVENDVMLKQTSNAEPYYFEQIGRYEACPDETYKVALLVGVNGHIWLRQNSDGFWSYFVKEDGDVFASNMDEAGNIIADPQLCSFEGYDTFVGYFAVTPWN